jgi:thiamine monophosphate kinase
MTKGEFRITEQADGKTSIGIEDYDVEYFGGCDHEMIYTLDPENLQKFMRALKCSRESLYQVIEEEFGVHLDKKNFGKWLQENEIKYDYFCWTS